MALDPPTRERAGVIVIGNDCLAVIHRRRATREYWVVPGGGVEDNETLADAAVREGAEELGCALDLGPLRVIIDHRLEYGSIQRQWYFEAATTSDRIEVVGPELAHIEDRGTYEAVWLPLEELTTRDVFPLAVAAAITNHRHAWPTEPIQIDETRRPLH